MMTKVGLVKFLMVLLIAQSAYSQKVKYKDIFSLLSTKQYAQAEPFLKRYLKENDDNPNAFLYMGIVYQEKSLKNDILKETAQALQNMDSAVFFYDQALKIIDDKEIRRNSEYYESYNRRDLRTGEFGVKLADVQFDIEKKIEGLKERTGRLKMAKHYFSLSDSLYKKCQALYSSFQKANPAEKDFLLRADENTIKQLSMLESRFDSVMRMFDNYHSISQNLGKTGYNQAVKQQDIVDFSKEGSSPADFYRDEVMLWDYKKFSAASREKIQKAVIPMREKLVSFDMEINKFREKLHQDSATVKKELALLREKLPVAELRKFDPDPLPLNVFVMKMADLEYKSILIEHKSWRDSMDVNLQIRMVETEKRSISLLDSISGKLEASDIEEEARNYSYFVTTAYENAVVLKSYIKALKVYAVRESGKVDARLDKYTERLKWIKLDHDSVPLLFSEINHTTFKPLIVEPDKYTVGLSYADSLNVSGYFYTITPSRRPDVKEVFEVSKPDFKLSRFPSIGAISTDNNGQVYFIAIYSEVAVKEKHAVTVAKIYRSDGLAWTMNYQLNHIPAELTFKPETGELSIKQSNQEVSVLDKNGKLKK